MAEGKVQVDRATLKTMLMEQHGMTEEAAGRVAMRARITIEAVVHRACKRCGGYTAPNHMRIRRPEEDPNTYPCTCIAGPLAKVEDKGVISDSGPRKLFPRLLWRAKEAIKRRAAK
jgi:hypothetical protein